MIPRLDLLDGRSPKGLEIFQLTSESIPSSHIYMEAQIFSPDSKRFLLHRCAAAHGADRTDPRHQYLLCDLDDNARLIPVTDELGAYAPCVSPDGRYIYYFVDRTQPNTGTLTLKRRNLDGTDPQTLLVIDGPLPGTKMRPSKVFPHPTISSNGQRLAFAAFLGDGLVRGPWGLVVIDLPTAEPRLILHGPSWCNLHPQYSRSLEAPASHDILVQENHANVCDPQGKLLTSTDGRGADIHVIRDDGMNFRDMPWGRDGQEWCQGHQCWRGRTDWAITSTTPRPEPARLIESQAVTHIDHDGLLSGGIRNDLSARVARPMFFHFATDIAGKRFITDCALDDGQGAVFCARLGTAGEEPLQDLTYLLTPKCDWKGPQRAHIHPFLSPDGTMGFFNSDQTGVLQAYMIRRMPM